MVRNNEIKTYSGKNARLPGKYNFTSSDGEIHIYQNDDEQVICFWVFRGMLSGSVELVYISGNESLIYDNILDIYSVDKLKEHWYLVETEY